MNEEVQALFSHPTDYQAQLAWLKGDDRWLGGVLACWLEAQANHRYAQECISWKKKGFRKPPTSSPWEMRTPHIDNREVEGGWFSEPALAVLQALLEAGVDVQERLPNARMDAVELVWRLNEPVVLGWMLEHPSAPVASSWESRVFKDLNQTCLQWAVSCQDPSYLDALVNNGVGLGQRDKQDRTLMFHAGSLGAVNILLKNGLSTEAIDKNGTSVLAYWCRNRWWRTLKSDAVPDNREVKCRALMRDVPKFLGNPMETERRTAHMFDRFGTMEKWDLPLFDLQVQDGRHWKKSWPLPIFFAKESLSNCGIQSIRPLVELGQKTPWLEHLEQQTVAGLPDVGWIALAVWSASVGRVYATTEELLEKTGRALGVKDWWLDARVVNAALGVTRRLKGRSVYQKELERAWSPWLIALTQGSVPERNWDLIQRVVQWFWEEPSRQKGGFYFQRIHRAWQADPKKTTDQQAQWIRIAVERGLDQPITRSTVADLWREAGGWPEEKCSPEDLALLALLERSVSEVGEDVAKVRRKMMGRRLEGALAPSSVRSRGVRL